MIDDVKHLIEQLREPVWGESVRVVNDRLRTAALFLESLAAELEKVKQERDGLNILLGQAQSMLETRTRERDAAVEDVNIMGHNNPCCTTCSYKDRSMFDAPCSYCRLEYYPNGWQWRGVRKD